MKGIRALAFDLEAIVEDCLVLDPPVFPGALEFIWDVYEDGFPLALTTPVGSKVQHAIFTSLCLHIAFGVVVTGEMIQHGKPHPEPYIKTVELLGIPAKNVAVIEDAVNGIRSAKAAGCVAIGITTSVSREKLLMAGADQVVPDYASLRRLFNL